MRSPQTWGLIFLFLDSNQSLKGVEFAYKKILSLQRATSPNFEEIIEGRMTTMTNPLNLTDEQADQVFSILMRLVREDVITASQQERIFETLLGIEMTTEEG